MLLPAKRSRETVVLSDDSLLLPLRPNIYPAELAVSAALSLREKWLFWATNMPYFIAAVLTLLSSSVPASALHDPGALAMEACASTTVHGVILLVLACISTYWHGAQCQLMAWLYCRDEVTGTARLHAPRWLRRLLVADVSCSLLTVLVGGGCFGIVHTVLWILPAAALFIGARYYKQSGQMRAYVIGHGLWHIASALAISQILFNTSIPLTSWATPCARKTVSV
eukprot:jgi/Chrpa1/9889/Chrysochromulina_OHIO_Genome00017090-RA